MGREEGGYEPWSLRSRGFNDDSVLRLLEAVWRKKAKVHQKVEWGHGEKGERENE